jgi:hypothetical protein
MTDVPASCNRLYTIKPITGKGLGSVAASKISKGIHILLEEPLFKTSDFTKDIGSTEIIVLQEVKSLTKDQQRAFFALQNVQGHKCTPILGIAITNMLPLSASNSGGLFLEASRINHSCQPQAHLLHWLEALRWMGKTSEGIQVILSLEAHILISSLSIFRGVLLTCP